MDTDTGPADLGSDLRQLWWRQYGVAKGKSYDGLPEPVDRPDLEPITSQPLLNYLLGQSLERGRLDFSAPISLNHIYGDLLTAVYERHWGGSEKVAAAPHNCRRAPRPGHPALTPLAWEDFVRLLEEVALLAWHGTGRTVTANAVDKAWEELRLKDKLEAFKQGAEAGAVSLLVSFFFRQASRIGGEPTFEFTHKSFGEYLTARRLVRAIATTHDQRERNRHDPDDGWTSTRALERWAQTTGVTAVDSDLLGFLSRQIALQLGDHVKSWHRTLVELFDDQLRRALPMHKLELLTFGEMTRQARNAEEALLAVLNCCASTANVTSKIAWPDQCALSDLLHRLNHSRSGRVTRYCLSWLDTGSEDCRHDLYQVELIEARLETSNLQGSSLVRANLSSAKLANANLRRTELGGAHCYRSDFSNANLSGAHLHGATLWSANLRGAILSKALFGRAQFRGAHLAGANLAGANLAGADLLGVRELDSARGLDKVQNWKEARIERKWVKRLALDAEELGLEVVNDEEDEEEDWVESIRPQL